MLHVGGLKAAAKRTAFGEVTNTANARPSKDDSVISGKAGYEITEKAILLQENKKPAALLRPAQRPLSVSGLKGLLTNASNASITVKPSLDGIPQAAQAANTRKVLTKRNTTIFKDPASIASSQQEINYHQEIQTTTSIASLHLPIASQQQQIQPQQLVEPTQPKLLKTLSRSAANFTETKVENEESTDVSDSADEGVDGRFVGAYINNADGHVHFYQYSDELEEEQGPKRYDDNGVQLARDAKNVPGDDVGTEKRGEHIGEIPSTKNAERNVLPAVSEPEEYWDDEEDEENYDEEGYITARSYRSRGDNTTGGATTVLFPKMNQKVKKELAAATQLVEGSRTAEEIEDESWDTSMVAEYGDEIFQYMRELEVSALAIVSTQRR